MTALCGITLHAEGRGFIINANGREQHQPPRHVRRQAWFDELPADDQRTLTAWLWTWARQDRARRHRSRLAGAPQAR